MRQQLSVDYLKKESNLTRRAMRGDVFLQNPRKGQMRTIIDVGAKACISTFPQIYPHPVRTMACTGGACAGYGGCPIT